MRTAGGSEIRVAARAISRGDVLRVVLHPAQEGGAAGVLPGQAEEVETGHGGDAAAVLDAPVLVEDRRLNEGVIEREAGGPDHRLGGQR